MAFSVVPSQVVHIVDSAYNCIVAIYGPYNGAKVPGFQGLINKSAIPSYLPDGSDLPYSDISTLRFFFNLGQKVYIGVFNLKKLEIKIEFMLTAFPGSFVLPVCGSGNCGVAAVH